MSDFPTLAQRGRAARYKHPLLAGLLLITLAFAFHLYTRDPDLEVVEDRTVTVEMQPWSAGDHLVYEDFTVAIYINYADLQDYMAWRITETGAASSQEQMAAEMQRWKAEVDLAVADKGFYPLNLREHDYFIAHMLERGRASLVDERGSGTVESIQVHTYAYICGGLCGEGRRFFYFSHYQFFPYRDRLFFEVRDWVSVIRVSFLIERCDRECRAAR